MLELVSFGEALIDFLAEPATDTAQPVRFARYAGGAPANVAVGFARLGGVSHFLGALGRDMFGDFLVRSMAREGVRTDGIKRTRDANTALAFVSLDTHGERSFVFYRHPSADLFYRGEDFPAALYARPAVFHFCSNTLTHEGIREATHTGIEQARSAGHLVSFDVNLRQALWPGGGDTAMAPIMAALEQTDVLKLAHEELQYLADGDDDAEVIRRLLAQGPRLLVITDGARPIRYFTRDWQAELASPSVCAVDSTAAGDAFMAGLLFAMARDGIHARALAGWLRTRSCVEDAVRLGAACGAHAVTRFGSFTALPLMADLKT